MNSLPVPRRHRVLAALALAALALAGCTDESRMEGAVRDNFGNALAGVAVTVDKTTYAATTDQAGRYALHFDPGAVNVRFVKAGYAEGHFGVRMEKRKPTPIEPITLAKLPPGDGLWLVGAKSYAATGTCQLRIEADAATRRSVLLATGTPAKLDIGGPLPRAAAFLDTTPWPAGGAPTVTQLFRLGDNGEVLRQQAPGVAAIPNFVRLDPVPPPSASSGRWLSANLTAGTYVYAARGVVPGFGFGLDTNGPCYMFSVEAAAGP